MWLPAGVSAVDDPDLPDETAAIRPAPRQAVSGILRRIVDFALPPTCALCRSLIAEPGGLCPRCWSTLRFIERPYCERLGTPFSFDLGEGALSAPAIADPPEFDRLRAVAVFDGGARDLVHDLKYRDRTHLARPMGRMMARSGRDLLDDADLILPVPLHPLRLWRRRFNQSALLAREIAQASGITLSTNALRRVRRTRRQVGLERQARIDNMRGAFALTDPSEIAGRKVVLVDDVFTTGATVASATKVLKRAKAARVDVLVFARVVDPGAS